MYCVVCHKPLTEDEMFFSVFLNTDEETLCEPCWREEDMDY